MTTFFFILEKWTRVYPSLLLLFLEQKMEKWEKRTDFLRQNFYFVRRLQNSKGRNRKNVRQNCINNTSLFQNDTSFLHKQALVSKKRPTTEQKPPKFAIFKVAENRVFPNNFFLVRISTLNGGVENVNKSQIPRFYAQEYLWWNPKSAIRTWTDFIGWLSRLFTICFLRIGLRRKQLKTRCQQDNERWQ